MKQPNHGDLPVLTDRYDYLARWYKRVTWFGIFLDLLFIVQLLAGLGYFALLPGFDAVQARLARPYGVLLLSLTVFYVPAAIDLKRYRIYAVLAIFPSRASIAVASLAVAMQFGQSRGFALIGLANLLILIWQLLILLRIREVENPASLEVRAMRRWHLIKLSLVAVVLVAGIATTAWYKLLREEPQQFSSTEDYFKYGSIGAESTNGIPYWIWVVLPRIFPEYLPGPGGYNSLGLYTEPGKPLPVGFSTKTIGFPRVGVNCAVCHSATIRLSAGELPLFLPGGASTTFDPLRYQRFLFASAADPRFNAARILEEIDKIYALPLLDRALYRFLLVPETRQALLESRAEWTWTSARPEWGRGRIDPFNPAKVHLLHVDIDGTIGNSDIVPIWNLRARAKMAFHWDGLNTDLTEVVRSSALGDGAAPKDLPVEQLQRLQDWLMVLKPPPYPVDRFPIHTALAAAGKSAFERQCASCHALGGARTGQIIPLDEIGTDPERLRTWTKGAADAYNAYAKDYAWKFSHFRSTDGYVAPLLDAIWTRAPYLHNGSVPTLRDLLEPPDARPAFFYRGYDVFDPTKVGFVSQGLEAQRAGTPYDTKLRGNSNAGHIWGTTISASEKDALIEYLKTQ